MSLSRKNKIWSVAESLLERISKKDRSKAREQRPTKLHLDQLEERQLLSLTVATTENLLVNTSWQDIRGDVAVDSNQAGDLVVAWTAADRLANPDYDPKDDSSNIYLTDSDGKYVEDLNIYARYLTDEVQIVTIPQECVPNTLLGSDGNYYEPGEYKAVVASDGWYNVTLTDDDGNESLIQVQGRIESGTKNLIGPDGTSYEAGTFERITTGWYEVDITNADGVTEKTIVQGSIVQAGSFDLLYNANETQRFSIFGSGVARTESDTYTTSNSLSCFYIGLYAENELTWTLFKYDSTLLPGDNAANLQAAIRAIPGGEYKEVTVTAYSETDFDITFNGANWAGYDLPDVRVSNNYYNDISGLISLFQAPSFDISELSGITNFQRLILRDLFGARYTTEIASIINSSGRSDVIRRLQIARDSVADYLSSGVVTTVADIQSVTAYNSKGNKVGIVVDSDPYKTAQNIQNAFDNSASYPVMYAPITRGYEYNEKTHRYEYTTEPTTAYYSNQSYGSMQAAIKSLEVSVEPVAGTLNQFMVTFKGASGLTDQDPLIVSAATSATKEGKTYAYTDVVRQNVRTGEYEYNGAYDYDPKVATITVKEPSAVFRVNSPEVTDFVTDVDGDVVKDRYGDPIVNGTGRRDQSKPSVAVSNDGSFVVAWVNENADSLQPYNKTDIMARRFTVRAYLPEYGEGGYNADYVSDFYDNGTIGTGGQLGYQPPATAYDQSFVGDLYSLNANSNVKVQCVYPVADEFVVNASLNGIQDDPSISSNSDGNFLIAWTYVAQDNSYFGGIYGRQFNNEAQPITGDITFASSQVSSNYYGPSYVAMSEDGFAVVTWNYGVDFYQSVLEPYSDVFIVDGEQVATNAYGASVSFDYNNRYALAYTVEEEDGVGGTASLPVTDAYISIYEIVATDAADEEDDIFATSANNNNNNGNNGDNNNDDAATSLAVGQRQASEKYEVNEVLGATIVNAVTTGDQGRPSVGVDADGDVFVAYQGVGIDIQSITLANEEKMYSANFDDLYLQLKWEDFENNNLVYQHKQFYRGNKYSYEDKNADLIYYIKLALGWGYDEYGQFTDNGGTPLYSLRNYDCVDVDSYVRYFLAVAQKEGADTEQLTRLDAVLEALLSPLRNNGYDISFVNYGQTVYGDSVANAGNTGDNNDQDVAANIITDATVISGVVSGYRNGSSASFSLMFPANYVANGTLAFNIGIATARDNTTTNADTAESVAFNYSAYYNNGVINDIDGFVNGLSEALNSLDICNGDTDCFVVRLMPQTEVAFYDGTVGSIDLDVAPFSYLYSYTEDNVTYTGTRTVENYIGLQIIAQGSLHDTPLYIQYDADNSSLTLVDQAIEDADYSSHATLYVDRFGSYGNLQKNPHVANTSNGDVVVVWQMQQDVSATNRSDLYPSIGNSLKDKYSHIYLRAFTENTDNAGPIVTNVSLPNGEKVDDNQTVTSAVKDIVVSFSEDMTTLYDAQNAPNAQDASYIALHAVDNPSNWYLLRDGVIVAGAIESITYGLNASMNPARETVDENNEPIEQINQGELAYGTNRYEAIVHFADGFEPDDGNYTLVCSSMVQDAARNAIYSQGYAPDGSAAGYDGRNFELDFSVIRLNEALAFEYSTDEFRYNDYIPVTYVNDTVTNGADGNQYDFSHEALDTGDSLKQTTRSSILDDSSDYGPNTAQAIASNSNGDYVVVWTEEVRSENSDGSYTVTKTVYARTYRALYVKQADGTRAQVISDNAQSIIKVYESVGKFNAKGVEVGTKFTDPRQASVAIDDRGEFVVVWDMLTFGTGEDGSRDVYMAKYAYNGGQMSINGNSTSPTRANVETSDDQQYPAVAMDSDGDIVVVWESYGQDGSGWGIYGRRFVTNGLSYGYQNTIQTIQIIGSINVQGDTLALSGAVDGQQYSVTVDLSVEMRANMKRIKDALVGTGLFNENDVEVSVSSAGEITIEYKGQYTATYVDMLTATTNNPKLTVNVAMRQVGVEGAEFLVNETTDNNQRFAAIGMEPDGSFVVSWTSWGQDLDSPIESNIYARKFASNHVVSTTFGSVEELTRANNGSNKLTATDVGAKVISTDSIEYHQVYAGQGYDSVCYITVGGTPAEIDAGGTTDGGDIASGTGSLLTSRWHVLTAAHVVCDEDGTPIDLTEEPIYCTFETSAGTLTIPVESIYVHPSYAGDPSDNQVDLAVLVLATSAPSYLTGYQLYTGNSEVGQTITFVGYGLYGDVMDDEDEIAARTAGVKHEGQNVYELTGSNFDNAGNPNTLIYDFDDGTYANDYLGNYYGIRNLGLGEDEAITAPGDSGSPSFINGQIAGVCSYGSDFDGDDSFGPGNYQVDVRVSAYADWINSVILSGLGNEFLVNTDSNIFIDVDADDDEGGNQGDEDVVVVDDFWQRGSQRWSSVSLDGDGNFVITWTGYNQDGNGDALTGASNNGLGGIFMRVFRSETDSASMAGTSVYQVNEFTAYDQVHSQVAMANNGSFVIAYESFQDPTNEENSDMVDNFGIYARRYALTSEDVAVYSEDNDNVTVTYDTVYGLDEIGAEFRVSRFNPFDADADDADQLGVSVAVDSNGDMVFAWTDLSYPNDLDTNIESVVCLRSISLPDDTTPPYVVRANAVYTDREGEQQQVSLYSNSVTFASGRGPTSLVYSFSEYMYTAQMNADIKADEFDESKYDGTYAYSDNRNLENKDVKSVIDYNDWTFTKDGYTVTSAYIYDIIYGYNASTKVEDYLRAKGEDPADYITVADPDYATNSYELVILFKEQLPDGSYTLTLSDKVTDASGRNNLDGDYDGKAGGSFTVRFTVGVPSIGTDEEYIPSNDIIAFTGEYGGEGVPVVVSNSDGFIIVTEQQVLYELGTGNDGGNNNNNNNVNAAGDGTDAYGYYNTVVVDGTTYRIESDIIMRGFNADGSPNGVETRVNPYSEGNQIDPDIALTESGSYVVVWVGESDEALNGICARFYPGGHPLKGQTQVAGEHGTRCWGADVCINEETGLVLITWLQGSKDNPNKADEVYGRFYDLAGNAKGAAFKLVEQQDSMSIEKFDVASMSVNGEIKYVVVWEAYVESTKSFEIFQKTVTARSNQGYYSVVNGQTSQVNQSTYRGQYDPQIATNQVDGEYYIVWVSDHVSANGADIYARRYNASGASLSFMGTTNEALVNTIVKHVQGAPSVACNSDGVVFAWESFDAEEFNYDSSSGVKQEIHDYGVAVRVFNSAGYPVYVDGYIYETIDGIKQVVPRAYGQQLNLDEGEFIINTTTAGNQIAPSVAVFDWDTVGDSEYAVPRFVVAWAGPNANAGEEIETDDGGTDNNNNNNNNNNNLNATNGTSYIGPYCVFYKYVAVASSASSNGDAVITSSKSSRYSTDPHSASSNGFYRPIDTLVETVAAVQADVDKVDSSTLKIDGTDGDDAVVVTTRNGKIVSVTVNGKTTNVSSKVEAVYFDGLAGNDSVLYVGSGQESASVDLGSAKTLVVGEQAFVAVNAESFDATNVGAIDVQANSTKDVVNAAPGVVDATSGSGFRFRASGVAELVAKGGQKATIVMAGSSGNDELVSVGASVALTGAGYSLQASDFSLVRVDAGLGANTATLSGVQGLTASDSVVIAASGSQTVVAVGFENVDAKGTGLATANVYGTRRNDSVVTDAQSATTRFSTGSVLTLSGFNNVAFDGRGGDDSAVLLAGNGANVFDGAWRSASLTNGSFTRTLANFSNVEVRANSESDKATLVATLHDTALNDAFAAYDDTAAMDVDGDRLYTIVAADQVKVERSVSKGVDSLDVDDAIDFVFTVDNWDE